MSRWGKETCQWPGVRCDAFGHITALLWDKISVYEGGFEFKGTPAWENLPPYLVHISLSEHRLSGSPIPLDRLPPKLVWFNVGQNFMSGPLCLSELPPSLETLMLHKNEFSDSVDLNSLPPFLRVLYLNNNKLSDSISLDRLPATLRVLKLQENKFSGVFDVRVLLQRALYEVEIDARWNAFGDYYPKQMPAHIQR